MVETRYKFLKTEGGLRSASGNQDWVVGEWYEVEEPVKLCKKGFHCSSRMLDAFGYVKGGAVARVEVSGSSGSGTDKEVWQRMRLVDVRQWRKEDSVSLAVFAARSVLGNFEAAYPGDNRPRKAIETAEACLENPNAANAADAADAAAYASNAASNAAAYAAAADAADAANAASAYAAAADAAADAADAAAAYAADAAAYADAADAANAADVDAADAANAADVDAYAANAADAAAAAANADAAAVRRSISEWMEARFETLPKYKVKPLAKLT